MIHTVLRDPGWQRPHLFVAVPSATSGSGVTAALEESNEGLGTRLRMVQPRDGKATSVYRELARNSINTVAP